jgi:hypothetical protein
MQPMGKHTHGKGRDKPACGKKQVRVVAAEYFQLEFKQSRSSHADLCL